MSFQVTVRPHNAKPDEQVIIKEFDKNEIFLGREPKNDVVLERRGVAERHAKLRVSLEKDAADPRFYLTDLGSDQGTMVGEDKLLAHREVEIRPDQTIRIGEYTLKPEPVIQTLKNGVKIIKTNPRETTEFPDFSRFLEGRVSGLSKLEKEQDGAGKNSSTSVKSATLTVSGQLKQSHVVNFDFVASKIVELSGKVTHNGQPIVGVAVDGGELGMATTGQDGTFSFPDAKEGTRFSLKATKSGYTFQSSDAVGSIEEGKSINFTATQLFSVNGRILHGDKPLSGVTVDCGTFGRVVTDDEGSYIVKDVPENSAFSITVSKDGYAFEQRGVDHGASSSRLN